MDAVFPFGKQVNQAFYLHTDYLDRIANDELRELSADLLQRIREEYQQTPNVLKWTRPTRQLSLLCYPNFDTEAFPVLRAAWTCLADTPRSLTYRRYDQSINPPILHRKELLVAPDHPASASWSTLSRDAQALGLFDSPNTIGFLRNWERLILSKGYTLQDGRFQPVGNDLPALEATPNPSTGTTVQRHLTALSRSGMSAPVQLLLRHGLLNESSSFFDYGCGRGDDVRALLAEGFDARGWDPHYAREEAVCSADVVNLGFVINVIEDPVERVEAIAQAFALTRRVLAIAVMLEGSHASGRPFQDGVLTTRNTFQKYFSQEELKTYIESVLDEPTLPIAPGVVLVFADKEWEQRFVAGRYRRQGLAPRLLLQRQRAPSRPAKSTDQPPPRLDACQPFLDRLWLASLELGRQPEPEELADELALPSPLRSFRAAWKLVEQNYDLRLLTEAGQVRRDDLTVYLATEQLRRSPPYASLEPRIRTDIRAFFGSYQVAREQARLLLLQTGDRQAVLEACQVAAAKGLGWLNGSHSLQVHSSLVERLPSVLRAYVACGLLLWGGLGNANLVKIHITSGKLTLLEFDDFEDNPLPYLRRRIKLDMRRIGYDLFDYGSIAYPAPILYFKSRYLHEEIPGYADQLAFDEALDACGVVTDETFTRSSLERALSNIRLEIRNNQLLSATSIPDLDEPCGVHLRYRDLILCGATQRSLSILNLPKQPDSYNALNALARHILDPVIEYFGAIELTYGFCSPALSRHISRRVAPALDQHAAHELTSRGTPICERGGAACDFLVADEDMLEVADWIIAHLPFDRLYYYGRNLPLHVSYSSTPKRAAFMMALSARGTLLPRPFAHAHSNPS